MASLYDFFYEQLGKYYKNEYFYKNILAKEIVKEKHQYKKVTYLNEFRVSESIVDVAVFNGSSTAYEIKTEFDNFDRLKSQLPSYQEVFEYINLVVDERKIISLEKILPDNIGILVLSDDNKIYEHKSAKSNLDNLDKKSILDTLRLSEIIAFAKRNLGYKPTGRIQQQKNECYDLFLQLSLEELHLIYVKIMHSRSFKGYETSIFPKITNSLLALLFNLRLSKPQLINLNNTLKCEYNYFW
ncbi:MAG TPA: sce7726 family protein [Tissierellaceae bacterium]